MLNHVNRELWCCAALAALCLGGASWAEEITATHQVRVEDQDKEPRADSLDVRAIALVTDGSALTVHVETNQDIGAYLKDNLATGLATLLIDSDRDESTGGKTFSHDPVGIEREVKIYACIAYDNGAEACAGGFGGAAVVKTYPKYSPTHWSNDTSAFEDVHEWPWDGGKGSFEGSTATVSIPYSDLGIESGDQVRLFVFGSIFDELGESPIMLTVK